MDKVYVIGDVHGHLKKLQHLLRDAQLMDAADQWIGKQALLCFIGDYVDRGPDSIACLTLIMELQRQAEQVGGRVLTLLGNHDVGILSAYFLQSEPSDGPGGTFLRDWERNGGRKNDLRLLTATHVEWMLRQPAMARHGDLLLVHADATLYYQYGNTIEEVNRNIAAVLHGRDGEAWDYLLEQFGNRMDFIDDDVLDREGTAEARHFLKQYGGTRIVHGHTPIMKITGKRAVEVTKPLIYAEGLCVNVDGGMYLGGSGFI
ncbi:MAG: serine/threonine protein phosphatase, partial [Anaerolineae bacterium]|nr:serine/threonine protein phosphatase [Anaerolineae bacterium]